MVPAGAAGSGDSRDDDEPQSGFFAKKVSEEGVKVGMGVLFGAPAAFATLLPLLFQLVAKGEGNSQRLAELYCTFVIGYFFLPIAFVAATLQGKWPTWKSAWLLALLGTICFIVVHLHYTGVPGDAVLGTIVAGVLLLAAGRALARARGRRTTARMVLHMSQVWVGRVVRVRSPLPDHPGKRGIRRFGVSIRWRARVYRRRLVHGVEGAAGILMILLALGGTAWLVGRVNLLDASRSALGRGEQMRITNERRDVSARLLAASRERSLASLEAQVRLGGAADAQASASPQARRLQLALGELDAARAAIWAASDSVAPRDAARGADPARRALSAALLQSRLADRLNAATMLYNQAAGEIVQAQQDTVAALSDSARAAAAAAAKVRKAAQKESAELYNGVRTTAAVVLAVALLLAVCGYGVSQSRLSAAAASKPEKRAARARARTFALGTALFTLLFVPLLATVEEEDVKPEDPRNPFALAQWYLPQLVTTQVSLDEGGTGGALTRSQPAQAVGPGATNAPGGKGTTDSTGGPIPPPDTLVVVDVNAVKALTNEIADYRGEVDQLRSSVGRRFDSLDTIIRQELGDVSP